MENGGWRMEVGGCSLGRNMWATCSEPPHLSSSVECLLALITPVLHWKVAEYSHLHRHLHRLISGILKRPEAPL
jgi:hypothetical protein